ncbi:PilW family protein [Acetonema longum]|uniref:Prepilin-type N-terminal cleavage/methylation domain-containing protein n=1 Tax=Acetonema longum DSM 6540 TaxID=1009370 RepID=F7NPR4_9FIRM|nr:prepilin-type N-terminal cleavage/methylation domain-containing protein [Acetonema longum]EGO61905.1 hypothetical protein ALO_20557 [Acetonema longum DSM 6540]
MSLNAGRQAGKSQQGFTLVELMVAVMLAIMMITVMAGIMRVSVKLYNSSVHQLQIQQNARLAAEYMVRDFRYARQIGAVDTGSARLQDKTGAEVMYRLGTNHVLYRVRNGGINALTDEKYAVSDLIFQWRDSGIMHISFAVQNPATGDSFRIDTGVAPLNLSD